MPTSLFGGEAGGSEGGQFAGSSLLRLGEDGNDIFWFRQFAPKNMRGRLFALLDSVRTGKF